MNSNGLFESGNKCSFISSRNNGSLADRINGCETMLERALALWELGFHIFPAGSPHEEVPQYFIDQQGGDMNSANAPDSTTASIASNTSNVRTL